MTWLFFALLAPVLYAGANMIDERLVNRLFKHKAPALVFYSSLTNTLFLPFIFFFGMPQHITISQFGIFFVTWFYWGSISVSLFQSIGKN